MATVKLNPTSQQINITETKGTSLQNEEAIQHTNIRINETIQSATVPASDRAYTTAVMDTDKTL